MSINHYLGIVDGVMNFYCVRPDHSESVRDEHVLRRDYDALRSRLAAAETVLKMRPTMNMDQCETYCETAKLLVARAENAEAALVEANETITDIPTLCRRYEARLAEAEALLRGARASIPCNAKFTLRRIDAFLATADSASGVQK